jgi:hypothetical protein
MCHKELCTRCDAFTGRAGKFDDSIFVGLPDGDRYGPVCEKCYARLSAAIACVIDGGIFNRCAELIRSVRATETRIMCDDIRGTNWFDEQDSVLSIIEDFET